MFVNSPASIDYLFHNIHPIFDDDSIIVYFLIVCIVLMTLTIIGNGLAFYSALAYKKPNFLIMLLVVSAITTAGCIFVTPFLFYAGNFVGGSILLIPIGIIILKSN